ncbi:MAG: hypothetical protein IPG45_29640 [Deltaproteobacteria bacterium]|jgi:tetratricopeptide (TPR) repeat protein|nr:hypothetical protein [Deltaproteobacteria bacterium]
MALRLALLGFLTLLAACPQPATVVPDQALRFSEAQRLHKQAQETEALRIYRELAPRHLPSRCYAAVLAARLEQAQTATVTLQAAIKEQPEEPHCLTLYGRELIYGKRPKEALPILEKAWAHAPQDVASRAFIQASLGFAQFTSFQYKEAAAAFEQAATLDGSVAMYAYNAGFSHFEYGNYAAAQPLLEKAVLQGLDEDVGLAAADQLDIIKRGATWVCPMHPEERGKEGDICAQCRMKLEPVSNGVPSE